MSKEQRVEKMMSDARSLMVAGRCEEAVILMLDAQSVDTEDENFGDCKVSWLSRVMRIIIGATACSFGYSLINK